jgi:NADH-quinone oxidoreductase subunit H
MKRAIGITVAILVIVFAIPFGLMALTYLADAGVLHLLPNFPAIARIVNIVVLLLLFVMIIATLLTLGERKWSAAMQDRIGPNRARLSIIPGLKNAPLAGLPHVAADSLKMLFKEDFMPDGANKWLFTLGPILAFAPVFALFAVVPAGPSIELFGKHVDMVIATPDFGLLYIFAIASLAVYGTALAGWSSNNKLALLGGVRASSQMVSYEVALGLSLVGMMIAFSTVQLPALTNGQASYLWKTDRIFGWEFDLGLPAWGIFLQPLGFVLFFAAAFAETKRAPFDVPEGESEIIGYFIEYSGMKFGMFMISEFVEVVVLSAVSTAIFFGGYHLPFGEQWLGRQGIFNTWSLGPALWGGLLGMVFWVKVVFLCWVQLLIRWTFPRFRYDQIQTLGWKMLLPAGLMNLFLSGALILWDPSLRGLAIVGMLEIAFVIGLTLTRPAVSSHAHPHGLEPHGTGHGMGTHAPTSPPPSPVVPGAAATHSH